MKEINMWKEVIIKLTTTTKILAEWQLISGVTFHMYLPALSEIGSETIKKDSDVRFDEIIKLNIMKNQNFGPLSAHNDLDLCRQALIENSSVKINEIDGGISIIACLPK